MKFVLLNTHGIYSHKLVYDGIREALEQLRQENFLDFIEVNIGEQDGPKIYDYNPDWIFASSPLAAGLRVWKKYRNKKVICYDTEGIYENLGMETLNYCDVMATVDKKAVDVYKEHSKDCKIHHMPLGFSPSVYRFQDVENEYKADITMAGVLFDRRRKIVEYLHEIKDLVKFRLICPADWANRVIHPNSIAYFHREVISPERMAKYYVGSKIILAVNRDYSPSNPLGMQSTTPGRVFQETACRRAVMVDNSRPEIFDYFEDNKEIITFNPDNKNEFLDKVLYYLKNEEEREAIAYNGYVRTMKENTWKKRLIKLIKEAL